MSSQFVSNEIRFQLGLFMEPALSRLSFALRWATGHLAISVAVVALAALLVFAVWCY